MFASLKQVLAGAGLAVPAGAMFVSQVVPNARADDEEEVPKC
jgi:hypothetical protein